MNREIRFRAWNKQNGIMDVVELYGNSIAICKYDYEKGGYYSKDSFNIHEQGALAGGKSKCILMQYTGLKDKNGKGKEIYEGDILKVGENLNCIIEYIAINKNEKGDEISGAFHLNVIGREEKFTFDEYALSTCRIIGNIYSNPELLK